jgi:hypothetical protein
MKFVQAALFLSLSAVSASWTRRKDRSQKKDWNAPPNKKAVGA